jgi:hypothetical protein
MNSYPPDLLHQLSPLMFVAGLDQFKHNDQFSSLTSRLRDALQSPTPTIYNPTKPKPFHVLLVDKSTRFPPRKLLQHDDPAYSHAHSPLSPLTPSSPLHPDGLIAPIWIRKHTQLLPAVFVLFLRIFEHPPLSHVPRSPLDYAPEQDRERLDEERRRDAELAAEVALRKKATNERGIKLTVVLLATRRMLGTYLYYSTS